MPPKISQKTIVNVKVGGCDGYCSCKGKKKCGKPKRKTASRRAGSASSPGGFTGSEPRRYMTNSIGSGASVMVRDGLPVLMDGNRHVSNEASNALSSQRFQGMINEAISKQNVWISENVNQMRQPTRGEQLLNVNENIVTPPSSTAAPSTTEGTENTDERDTLESQGRRMRSDSRKVPYTVRNLASAFSGSRGSGTRSGVTYLIPKSKIKKK